MYGNIGVRDVETIDLYLACLRRCGIVVNLGCGPNVNGQLHNLARVMGRYQRQSTLVLEDIDTSSIDNQLWVPGPDKVAVVKLNAATATEVLGIGQADLVLAFGLFGALTSTTTSKGTGKAAWPTVLIECFRALRIAGKLLVNNSSKRQPFEEFKKAVERAGFTIADHHMSASIWARHHPAEERYFVVCRKSRRSKAAV